MANLYADRTLKNLVCERQETLSERADGEITQVEALLTLLDDEALSEYERMLDHSTQREHDLAPRYRRLDRCRQLLTQQAS